MAGFRGRGKFKLIKFLPLKWCDTLSYIGNVGARGYIFFGEPATKKLKEKKEKTIFFSVSSSRFVLASSPEKK